MHVLLKAEEDTYCAKCCKTMNIIERIFASIPEFKEKIEVSYEDVYSIDNIKKYGDLTPPAIIIEERILTEGHVPIMKKLARDLYKLIEPAKFNT
ncbi:MAG: thioredoxin family protein [Candidatus Hodarchaeota archaeon]